MFKWIGILCLCVLCCCPMVAKADDSANAAIVAQLKMMTETLTALTARLDKIEGERATASTAAVRTALTRQPSANLNAALNTTGQQCQGGSCGRSR
jgi:hypothetical protein